MASADDMMEMENQAALGRLGERTKMLKEIAAGLDRTLQEDNRMLSMMDGQFSGVGSLLDGVQQKMGITFQGTKTHTCYIAVFICVIFVVVYKWVL